jgi:N-acetylglucosamine malate deacetylase 2
MADAQALLLAILHAAEGEPLPALPRTMLVGAHPDDETVLAGARLRRLSAALFVCVTDGAPRNGYDSGRHGLTPAAYAQARRRELEGVLGRCGIAARQVLSLDCPDQQASLLLAPAARNLAALMAQHGTEVVLSHAYEGGHPDHDASAFIVHAAVALLRARGSSAPAIVEMAGYRRRADGERACAFLPRPDGAEDGAVMLELTAEELRWKAELIAGFTTQRETLGGFPVEGEGYRPAPAYDFRQPPHAGKLHYENYPWGMTGERFRELAADALRELGLEAPL